MESLTPTFTSNRAIASLLQFPPLPSPAELKDYEQVIPGSAQQILNDWLKGNKARHIGMLILASALAITLALSCSIWLFFAAKGAQRGYSYLFKQLRE